MENLKKQQSVSAIMGFVVADALGVPVEFVSRMELEKNPVVDMRSYGTHNQPQGTWSDDSSMSVATMEWITGLKNSCVKYDHVDYNELMKKFMSWLSHGEYTPYGKVFDCGIATNNAITSYKCGTEPVLCGGKSEQDNGNGSLMRILPVAIWNSKALAGGIDESADLIFNISSLTHGHMRSKLGCLIYSKIIADMINIEINNRQENENCNKYNKFDVVEKSINECKEFILSSNNEEILKEGDKYSRLWDLKEFKELSSSHINSSGYVVSTLEAAIWCFLNTDSYKECVLKAVNLGDDTDTVGAVAGGLAGLYYGINEIPDEWIEVIPKKEWIMELAEMIVE